MTKVRQGFVVTTAPAVEPVTLAQVKAHSRIDISDDDTLIDGLIVAARTYMETNTRRGLITQTVDITTNCFPPTHRLDLHVIAPLASVSSVKYYDENGDDQTLDSASYFVDVVTEPGAVQLAEGYSWPTVAVRPDAVRVKCVIGYGVAEDVPKDLTHAMLMLIGHWYENRETVVIGTITSDVPMAVTALMAPYLRPEFF